MQPFLGEIILASFQFPPAGWARCDGALLPINQNQALFSLLGTQFGGNGITTFALPDMRGRVPMGTGGGTIVGEAGGAATVTLTTAQMPFHWHVPPGGGAQSTSHPANAVAAVGGAYTTTPTSVLGTPVAVGANQAHENMQPYLVLTFVIALQGVYPSQN
jgi:microcystin-dependent protein